jgi:hypothetical protein
LVNRNEVFVTFKVEKSDYFRRDGSDIHTDAKISISQALLGGSIRVRGIYEDHTVQVLFKVYLLKSGVYCCVPSVQPLKSRCERIIPIKVLRLS